MADYFTLAEFRDLPNMNDEGKYPDEDVERAAAYITAIVEREVGTSFIPREVTETLDGSGHGMLRLSSPYIQSVTSVDLDGAPLTVGDLSTLHGFLRYTDGTYWVCGSGNVEVTYEAGYSEEPPADIKEAVMQATRARLLEKHGSARVQDRTSSVAGDAGGTTTFVLAGPDRPTGYPDVDAVIVGWRSRIRVPGVA